MDSVHAPSSTAPDGAKPPPKRRARTARYERGIRDQLRKHSINARLDAYDAGYRDGQADAENERARRALLAAIDAAFAVLDALDTEDSQ